MKKYPKRPKETIRHRLRPDEDFLNLPMEGPDIVAEAFRMMENERVVKVVCLFLNGFYEVLDCELMGMGSNARTLVDVRGILSRAAGSVANSVIVVLNHPGKSAKPSAHERAAYEKLVRIGREIGVVFLDMVIISASDWFSFADVEGQLVTYDNKNDVPSPVVEKKP